MSYILSVDQSTQSTKAFVFDATGQMIAQANRPHQQIINEQGWIEHDPDEIMRNVLATCREAVELAGIEQKELAAMAITNQRETVVVWERETGRPLYNAVVWQCSRAAELCESMAEIKETIQQKTGIPLSPYFPAAKLAWLLQNVDAVAQTAKAHHLCCGTVDSWLLYCLTEEHVFKTDYSNAGRTQLLNIHTLQWDNELCRIYGVPMEALPEVCMSDALYGHTTLGGWLEQAIPIHGILGDSHAALLGHGCLAPGQTKATYGTGSSVMMQTGNQLIKSKNGLVTSLAWGLDGRVSYVLEGNLNYTGAVISWLKDDLELIHSASETEQLACSANPLDRCCLVPAFSGLGAPYWNSAATAMFAGMTRTTGRAEIVKAALESIGFQITDLLCAMSSDASIPVTELCVDGGPTENKYLMQFQSDIANCRLRVSTLQGLSGFGAAYAAGKSIGLYEQSTLDSLGHICYIPQYSESWRKEKFAVWNNAVHLALSQHEIKRGKQL